ncbi:hypothetical protein DM867_12085 [Halosegnis rubeus]|jgi:hypothetical protein|uniref:Putative peptidase inhibitor domain-containing protein n=1 Tax=Halosegnis rubeus TaxID=2212850 RepID=A0A5N5UIR1_9EURY|nr:hypothetical protein [Halosegnis rubeus]KAB7512653.1 hypothetical protein DM867_12085 [Halosegnis rubeus]KAB7515521.1 hypothetical protein DP108_11170 [Halosegnis rubeus]KAB7518578.1 hypothetical protein DMP03_04285 [Halosegnis rubeus]
MYLSPAVRTARDDPTEGATARLTVRTDDDAASVREAVEAYGTVEGETRFGGVRASVPEPAVADLLDALPEVETVETWTAMAEEDGSEG